MRVFEAESADESADRTERFHYKDLSLGLTNAPLSPVLVTLCPGENDWNPFSYSGHEFSLVLEGTLTVGIDGEQTGPGGQESILFDAGKSHYWANRTAAPVLFLVVSLKSRQQAVISEKECCTMKYDVIIIGAGSMGMAAGYYLARDNKRVLLIDPYDPPHSEGSHHGATRLIRHAYGEGENYVPMALRAQKLWHELEEASGRKVFHQTGVLNIGTPNSSFIQNVIRSAKNYSLPHEILSAQEITRRWQGFRLPEGLMGCFEPASGVLMSEEAIRAYRELAVQHGAVLMPNTRVKELNVSDSGVSVTAGNTIHTGEKLIITAGKGTNTVLSMLDHVLPLYPMRTTFSWFDADESVYNPENFPAWTYDDGISGFYGFPSIDGTGLKIGNHGKGTPVSPETTLTPFSFSEDGQDVAEFLLEHAAFDTRHREGKACTYTNSPDEDFIIDRLADYDNVFVACGFSGHGFKFSSVVGELLYELATEGKTALDISNFSASRF